MKTNRIILLVALFIVLIASNARPQASTTCDGIIVTHNTDCDITNENVIVPDNDFWFGSFDDFFLVGPTDPSLCRLTNDAADLGFNMYYNYVSGLNDYGFLKFLKGYSTSANVKRNGIVSAGGVLNHWCGSFTSMNSFDASEFKFFVASNWDPKGVANYETNSNWNTIPAGWNTSSTNWSVPTAPNSNNTAQGEPEEAYVGLINNTNYILQTQQNDLPVSIKSNYDNKAICDFIFRFDITNDYGGNTTDDNAAYDIEFWVTNNGTTSNTTTVSISPQYYDEYTNQHNFNSTIWSSLTYGYGSGNGKFTDFIRTEQNNIKNFPIWSRASHRPYTSNELAQHNTKYAVIRTIIDIGSNPTITKIDCRLKPHSSTSGKGIFIRGLRVRSQMADDLLRSKIDGQVKNDFTTIKQALSGFNINQTNPSYDGSIDIWSKVPGIQACNECTVQGWPALAYVDQLFQKWSSGKRVFPFITDFNVQPWWRAVYEDLTTQLPPRFVPECADMWFADKASVDNVNFFETQGYPKDLIPTNIMNQSNFTLYGYPVQSYDVFTKRNQVFLDKCLGASGMSVHEAGFARPEPGRALAEWTGNTVDIGDFIFAAGNGAYIAGTQSGDSYGVVDPATGIPPTGSVRRKIYDEIHLGHYCNDFQPYVPFDLADVMTTKTSNIGGNSTSAAWIPSPYWATGIGSTSGTTPNYTLAGPEASSNNPTNGDNGTGNGNNFVPWILRMWNRFMTGTEKRCDAWGNLAWGAKGILLNTFLTQGSPQELGVLGNGATNHYDWWFDNLSCDDANQPNPLGSSSSPRFLTSFWIEPNDGTALINEPMYDEWSIVKSTNSYPNYGGRTMGWGTSTGAIWIKRNNNGTFPTLPTTQGGSDDQTFTLTAYDYNNGYTSTSYTKTFSDWMAYLFKFPTDNSDHTQKYQSVANAVCSTYVALHDAVAATPIDNASKSGSWRPLYPEDDAHNDYTQRWVAAFQNSDNCSGGGWYAGLFWPRDNTGQLLRVLPKTFLGNKERYNGVKDFANDIKPVMGYFKDLQWNATVNTNNLSSTDVTTWDAVFPIDRTSLVSRKFNNFQDNNPATYNYSFPHTLQVDGTGTPLDAYDNTVSENDQMLYTIGEFSPKPDPNVSATIDSTKYLIIVNRRTWPCYYETVNNVKQVQQFKSEAKIDPVTGNTITPNSDDQLLGPIDSREFSFRLNRKGLDDANGNFKYSLYKVTDLRTGREKIIQFGQHFQNDNTKPFIDTFAISLDPGEGTLLRISPEYSFSGGRTSDKGMSFNNGHRIAEIPANAVNQTPALRVMTWENAGKIQINIDNNPVLSGNENFVSENNAQTLQSQTFATGNSVPLITSNSDGTFEGLGMNPSIAVKDGKVAVIYNRQPTTNHPSRDVIFAWGNVVSVSGQFTIQWQEGLTIDPNVLANVNQPNQVVTPSISPAQNGFFCAWSKSDVNGGYLTPHYVQPAYINCTAPNATWQFINPFPGKLGIQAEQGALMSIFPSVATRDESNVGDAIERLHLAWEEQWAPSSTDTNAHIYYTRLDHNLTTGLFQIGLVPKPIERVSKFAVSCRNNHPNIAITNAYHTNTGFDDPHPTGINHGEPKVTWEMKIQEDIYPSPPNSGDGLPIHFVRPLYSKGDVYVMVRERSIPFGKGIWGAFTAFYPKSQNMPLPLIKTGDFDEIWGDFLPMGGGDFYSLTFQDTFSLEVHLERKYSGQGISWKFNWLHSKLIEQGLYPNLTLLYESNPTSPLSTLTFRGIDKDENNLYAARVTAKTTGVEVPLSKILVQSIKATPKPDPSCETGLTYSIGPAKQIPFFVGGTDTIYFNWQTWEYLNHDSTYYMDSTYSLTYEWHPTVDSFVTNSAHISAGDSIQLARIFHFSDSSLIGNNYFSDTTRYLTFEVDLKDSVTHQLVQVLDRVAIKSFPNGPQILDRNNIPVQFYPSGVNGGISFAPTNAIPLHVPPSGSGYLTLNIMKDTLTQFNHIQTEAYVDSFVTTPPVYDTTSYKKSNPTALQSSSINDIQLSIHPNPFRTQTDIEVDAPKNVPLNITVFDVLGRSTVTLFNNLSSSDHYSYTLDSKQLNQGMYFVRVQCGGEVVTRKIELVK